MTTSPTSSSIEAGTRANAEAARWMTVAREWHRGRQRPPLIDVQPMESSVVQLYDPADDLARRARTWNYEIASGDLSDLARFGAGKGKASRQALDPAAWG